FAAAEAQNSGDKQDRGGGAAEQGGASEAAAAERQQDSRQTLGLGRSQIAAHPASHPGLRKDRYDGTCSVQDCHQCAGGGGSVNDPQRQAHVEDHYPQRHEPVDADHGGGGRSGSGGGAAGFGGA